MTRQRKLFLGKSAAILGAIPVVIWAHSAGPDAGKSGVPNESTCAEAGCHTGAGINQSGGSVTVTFPDRMNYSPGVKQHLVVKFADPTARRWGFQLTAREAGNSRNQAGTFASTDGNTQIVCASSDLFQQSFNLKSCPASQPLQYIEHTTAGTRFGTTGSATFEFDWTPPAANVGNITIYVAGNGANGDQNSTGDHIYTANYTLASGAGGGTKPLISQNAVANGATFQGGITGAGFVQVKGTNLANIADPGRIWKDSEIVGGKLPTSLEGVSVTIDGKPAYIYFISAGQINAIVPTDSNQGPVNVVVTNNGQTSDAASVNLQPFAPGWFTFNGTNAIATRNPDGALIGDPTKTSGTTPAKPGDVIILWGTGFGPTNPATPDGQLPTVGTPLATPPTVTVGNLPAQFIGGAISQFAGLYQIAVTVPNVGDGDQPVVATSGGFSSPGNVTIYVKH